MKKTRIMVISVFVILTALAWADQGAGWKSLVQTEKAFARTAVDKGIRAAFLENLAQDAIVFRPQPTPGRPLQSTDVPINWCQRCFSPFTSARNWGKASLAPFVRL
jgi:hypothetical protein